MFTNLWLLDLYLAANMLMTLAFMSYAWLYYDLYFTQRANHALYKALGGSVLAGAFVLNLLSEDVNRDKPLLALLFLFSLGLVMILLGLQTEEIPGKPDLGKLAAKKPVTHPKSKKLAQIAFVPFIAFFSAALSFAVAVAITLKTWKKVGYGESKEFSPLFVFWLSFSIYLFMQLLSVLGANSLVWLEVFTRENSLIWIASQLILIVGFFAMLRWITVFISFRIFAKVFFTVWQIIVVISVVLTSLYSIYAIKNTEDQIFSLLDKNAQLVQFNLEQIKNNNLDVLGIFSEDTELIAAIGSQNEARISEQVSTFRKENLSIDRILVTDNQGIVVYDSDGLLAKGTSDSGNALIVKTVVEKKSQTGYMVEASSASADKLIYQFSEPVKNKYGDIIGVILTQKRIDDNYLDILKQQSDQELLIYVNEKRSASTILGEDGISRLENVPLLLDETNYKQLQTTADKTKFARVKILAEPYYVADIAINDVKGEKIADVLVGTRQEILINSLRTALYNTFLISLILNLLATIPSYYLAKDLSKNLAA